MICATLAVLATHAPRSISRREGDGAFIPQEEHDGAVEYLS